MAFIKSLMQIIDIMTNISKPKITEKCKPICKGVFHIDIIKDNKIIETHEVHNLIVNNSSKILAKAIGGSLIDSTSTSVSKIAFGAGDGARLPASVGKTTLDGELFTKNISSVTYDATNAPYDVQFNFSLDSGEFNGKNIWQFGLMRDDNTLFSMLSRIDKNYPIEKDATVTISGWWKIQFRNSAS